MTDNKITREMTFSEELPYFKERMKEISDNYDNPDGYADVLYLSALSDSNRIVRKAEEEITRQQAEIERLQKEVNLVSMQFQDIQERQEESQAEIERLKPFEDKITKFKSHIRVEDMLVFASSLEEWLEFCDNLKSEAIKEFCEKRGIKYVEDDV